MLSPPVLGKLVKKYAPEFIDGNVDFTHISASLFRDFPNPSLDAENFSITYPHARFAQYYGEGRRSACDAGRGGETDTLVSSRTISVTLDIMALLNKQIIVKRAEGDGTRAFIHYYTDDISNLDIFGGPPSEASEETPAESQTPAPAESAPAEDEGWLFRMFNAKLTGNPYCAYTDISNSDTLAIDISAGKIDMDGDLRFDKWQNLSIKLDSEDLRMGIKIPQDSLGFTADWLRFAPAGKGDHYYELKTDVLYDSKENGRYEVPVDWKGVLAITDPEEGFAINLKEVKGTTAEVGMEGYTDMLFLDEEMVVDGSIDIGGTPIQPLLDRFAPDVALGTDGSLSASLKLKGSYVYETGALPDIDLKLNIPRSSLRYPGFVKDGDLELSLAMLTDDKGAINMDLDTVYVNVDGLHLKAAGKCYDALGDDPRFKINGRVRSSLDSLLRFVPEEYGLSGRGQVDASVKADMRMSHLDARNYQYADIDAIISVKNLDLKDKADSIDLFVPKADIKLSAAGNKYDPALKKGDRVLGLLADIDSLSMTYCDNMFIRGKNVSVAAQNGATAQEGKFTPFMGFAKADRLVYRDTDSMLVAIRGTKDSFRMEPDPLIPSKPKFTIKSDNDRVFLRQDVNRIGLRNVSLNGEAYRHDSTTDTLRRRRPAVRRERPSWMSDEEFRKSDIDVSLDESFAQYIREWDVSGDVSVGRGMVVTPYFPLRNRVSDLKASFTTDEINLESLTVKSGESDLSASGQLKGLRRSLTGKGWLGLDLDISSDKIDVDELLAAYTVGAEFQPAEGLAVIAGNDDISDNDYQSMVVTDTLANVETDLDMIVIPANLRAKITLQGNEVKYKDLDIDWLSADLMMRQRTVQITNGVATSNMGDLYFEGFYSTHTREDIRGGLDINMIDITAEDVIRLVPAIGEMEPMLTNFKGKLDCELAAVSDMDTTMSFKLPSVNGVMSITGKDLSIEESPEFKEIAKTLLFRDKKKGNVKKMSVSGLVKDNSMELFPFVLKIDRYSLALSGVQNFDESFKYHVSVLKSPLLIKFGINLFGDDFDNWKFRLTRPRYRSSKVPVFTQEVNDAVGELRNTIHNVFETGSDRAVANYDAEKYLTRQGVTEEESLSQEEIDKIKQLNKEEAKTSEALEEMISDADIEASLQEEELIELDEKGNIVSPKKECWLKKAFRNCREKRAAKKAAE